MQKELLTIFNELQPLIKKYEKPMVAKFDLQGKYDLWSPKEVEIAGRKKKEVWFASLIIQSSYVGFYFAPIYAESALRKVFGKELLATLKGKSCFHIKELTPTIKKQIKDALAKGYKLYKERDWV